MNRILALIIIVLMVFAFGCAKNSQDNNSADHGHTEEDFIDPAVFSNLGVFVIDGSYSELRDDGKMHWKAGANAGDTFEWTGESREAVRAYDGATRNFYRAYSNGQELWVHDYFIAGPAVPAVIVNDDAVLYTKPDLSSVARSGIVTLPKYTIVAMLNDEDLTDDFIPVAAFLSLALPAERWVRLKDITWEPASVGTVKLARVASVTKNAAARTELLKNAMEMAEGGSSFGYVPSSVNYNPALFELEMTGNLEQLNSHMPYVIVSHDTVNKREMPSVDSAAKGTLSQGDLFMVLYKTKQTIELEAPDGESEKPKGVWLGADEGYWVFSAYAAETDYPY